MVEATFHFNLLIDILDCVDGTPFKVNQNINEIWISYVVQYAKRFSEESCVRGLGFIWQQSKNARKYSTTTLTVNGVELNELLWAYLESSICIPMF